MTEQNENSPSQPEVALDGREYYHYSIRLSYSIEINHIEDFNKTIILAFLNLNINRTKNMI